MTTREPFLVKTYNSSHVRYLIIHRFLGKERYNYFISSLKDSQMMLNSLTIFVLNSPLQSIRVYM